MGDRRSTALTIKSLTLGALCCLMLSGPLPALAEETAPVPSPVPAPAPAPIPAPAPETAPAFTPAPAPASDPALVFVQDHHLGESLGWLGYQVASRTVTFATIVEAVGRTQAQTLVQGELQNLQPQYQPEWDRNLAASYAQSFTPDELQQLNAGEPAPPLANKFRTKQRDVGMDMKGRSSELLKVYVSTALDSALKKAKP
jgi:hypothetical protein